MKYLQQRGYYENRYDKLVVNQCRMTESMLDNENLSINKDDNIPVENRKKGIKAYIDMDLYLRKGELAIKRDETIRKWMEDDEEKDNLLENAYLPNQYCIHCNKQMELIIKELYSISDKPYRVYFGFRCNNCKYTRCLFDNGEEDIREPTVCIKCSSKNLNVKFKNTNTHYITITNCKDCGYEEIDKTERYIEKIDENFEKDRQRFCLSESKTNDFIESKKQMDYMSDVLKKWEEEKVIKEEKANIDNITKLDIVGLKELLKQNLKKPIYSNIGLINPQIKKEILIDLNVFMKNLDLNIFSKTLNTILSNTNWELLENSTISKLGIICCKLRGFETDEELVLLVRKRRNI